MKFIHYLRFLLLPFSLVYGLVMAVRNACYHSGIFKSTHYNIPVIGIGNISVGGTGKTPHTEYIIALLKNMKNVAVLSRGYKRSTKGFVEVQDGSKAYISGDEPLQMKSKFPEVRIVVDEDRCHGINQLLDGADAPDVILLDDAFQHRSVKLGLNILLVDFNRPIKKDLVMPAGNLREFSCGRKRADIVIITKCPNLFDHEIQNWRNKYSLPHQQLFFSTYEYRQLTPVFNGSASLTVDQLVDYEVFLITGIANHKPLVKYLTSKCARLNAMHYADHYLFAEQDAVEILKKFTESTAVNKTIITTEKDAVRLKDFAILQNKLRNNLFYLPVSVRILFGEGETLNKTILKYVQEN